MTNMKPKTYFLRPDVALQVTAGGGGWGVGDAALLLAVRQG